MKFEAQRGGGVLRVEGYVGRGFRVGGRAFEGGVLVTPDAAWPLVALDADGLASLDIAEPPVELVLLGTGATTTLPAPALLAHLRSRGLAFETMDSRAAARTYNVLALEDRRVAAALLPL